MSELGGVASGLFGPYSIGSMTVRNRFVMAPMTREFSQCGVVSDAAPEYYARRVRGGVGLVVTEGIVVDHPAAAASSRVPQLHDEHTRSAWGDVVDAVHAAGGAIIAQLWHVGLDRAARAAPHPDAPSLGPGTWFGETRHDRRAMTAADIDDVIDSFARAAQAAEQVGFDGVELHGGHGYLLDQFLWEKTNTRTDAYGGDPCNRSRFPAEVVSEIRHRVSREYPIVFRLSQWKSIDLGARPYPTPAVLDAALGPLVDAGVDGFHASTRRFWTPEFEGSDLGLAGWIKKLTDAPTITVGSVGLDGADFVDAIVSGAGAQPDSLTRVSRMFERGHFDLVAIGRALISDSDLVEKLRGAHDAPRIPFDARDLLTLT